MGNEEEIQERTKRIEELLGQLVEQSKCLQSSVDDFDSRLKQLETKTTGVVSAFDAASGAFVFLETLAKIVKPIAFITVTVGGFILWLKGMK